MTSESEVETSKNLRVLTEAQADDSEKESFAAPLVMAVVLFMIPFFATVFLTFNRSKLGSQKFKLRFGALYQHVKAHSLHSALYAVYFLCIFALMYYILKRSN